MIPVKAEKVPYSGDYKEFERLPAGAYVCKVVNAVPNEEKGYLLLTCDITEGEFKDFGKRVEAETDKDFGYIKIYKSWKDNGKPDGQNPLWFFRQMLARFEQENQGKYQQTDMDEKHLIGLSIGIVLREEEYLGRDGDIKTSAKFYNFAEIERIREGKVKTPKMKELPNDIKNPPLAQEDKEDKSDIFAPQQQEEVDPNKCPF